MTAWRSAEASDDAPVPVARLPWDLSGWGEVAAFLQVSIRQAQRLEVEGLPVYRFRGRAVRARAAELVHWVEVRTVRGTRT